MAKFPFNAPCVGTNVDTSVSQVWAQMWALRGAADGSAQVTQLRKRLLNPPTGVLRGGWWVPPKMLYMDPRECLQCHFIRLYA